VHLNGPRFDTTHGAINIDGQSGTQNGLHAGHVIEVRGAWNGATLTATQAQIGQDGED